MSISSSQVSLRALRQDLDMSANGRMRERPIWNKDGQKTSGNISLAAYKGNLLGGQLAITGSANATPSNRQYGYTGFWPANGGTPSISGNEIRTYSRMTGAGGGDASSEYRVSGYCSESGTYRLTGQLNFNMSGYYRVQSWQVAVVSSSSGYMAGATEVQVVASGNFTGVTSLNRTFSLSASKPYVTLILYSITKSGGDPSEGTFATSWTDIKVVKV